MARTDTLIVGAGQAALALSRELTLAGHDHVLLERGRIGERWRSERWDSLALLTPNWANLLPGQAPTADPDGYLTGRAWATELERYARSFGAPVRRRTTVTAVRRGRRGFAVETDDGAWSAGAVVVAAGECGAPVRPACAAAAPTHLHQLDAAAYRSPDRLPAGGVLVVGSGPSGHQIAHELALAGRDVTLALGRHARIPRTYRGHDVWSWLEALGDLRRTRAELGHDPLERPTPGFPLDGRDGGRTLDLAVLSDLGVRVTGRVVGFDGDRVRFGGELTATAAEADERLRTLLARIDEHIAARPDAGAFPPPELPRTVRLDAVPRTLSLRGAGITTIVWATGFRPHHPWLRVRGAVGSNGRIRHRRGVTPVPGLFVLGARWQHRTTSHQIGGVGADARHLAAHVARAAAGAQPAGRRATAVRASSS